MTMRYINSAHIIKFFNGLNDAGVKYVLIKNIGDELPCHLPNGKDIDIVVHEDSVTVFHQYMLNNGRKVIHPYGKEAGWNNIYRLPEFEFWRLNASDDIFVDVSNMLSCHSLTPHVWLPLDNHIQLDLWKNKVFDEENQWWIIDSNIQYVYLAVRCVLDKRCFPPAYCQEIKRKRSQIDIEKVKYYLRFVFFNFTDTLVDMLDNGDFSNVIDAYISYKDY